MAEVKKKFIIRNQSETGTWETLYPQTTAEQVITDPTKLFVTQAQIDSWDAKAGSSDTTTAINTAKEYTDTQLAALIDNAPAALDTLAELATALTAHETEYDALLEVVGLKATAADLTAHINNKANPHAVTKAQVGLSNVDNTSDLLKPVSTATQAALSGKVDTATLTAHTADKANPHGVTKAQVGLGNVDNTTDLLKPVSTATQTALNGKVDTATLTAHTGNTANPHGVTKAQVGLGSVDNTADLAKPISTATQTALNAKAATTYVDNAVKAIPAVTVGTTAPTAPKNGDIWYEILV